MKAAFIECWRVLRWLLLAVLLLALTLIAALWWANRHDDPLRPEVAALLKFEPPSPEAMRGNGYFTMLVLGAPAGEDAFEAGQRCFAAQMRGYERLQQTGKLEFASQNACESPSVLLTPMRCDANAGNCAAHYVKHAEAIRQALDKHAALVQRYRQMMELPEYVEVIPPDFANLPGYQNLVAASELWDMQAVLLLADGQTSEALHMLRQNAGLHRRMMNGARTLLGGMLAVAMETRHQRAVNGLIRQWPKMAQQYVGELKAALGETDAMGMIPALKGEMRFTLTTSSLLHIHLLFDDAPFEEQLRNFVLSPVVWTSYLPNATLNQSYQNLQTVIHLAHLPADQLGPHAAEAAETAWKAVEGQGILPFRLRNFWGNIQVGIAGPGLYVPYIERAHDVEAHRRLVQLQITALQEHIPFDQMTAWLAAQPPELRNPYTLQPMGWDAAAQALIFEGRQPNTQNPEPRNVFRVPIGPVEAGAIANQRQ